MSGYVKIWTTMRNNTDFLSLSGNGRGMYLQLILACKDQRDDGLVCYRNVSAFGQDMGIERSTCKRLLLKLAENKLASYVIRSNGVVEVTIDNYKWWQEITVDEVRKGKRNFSAKNTPLRPDQTRSDQTKVIRLSGKKPDKITNPEHKYKIQKIMDAIGRHYIKKPTGSQCGMILKIAETVGEAIVAVEISATWGQGEAEYQNYMPKIRRALQNRRTWLEESHEQAKTENKKFAEWMDQKFGNKIGKILPTIGKEVK